MQKNFYFFGLFLISFLLCLGFLDIRFTSICTYFSYLFYGEIDLVYQLSFLFLIVSLYYLIRIIRSSLKLYKNK